MAIKASVNGVLRREGRVLLIQRGGTAYFPGWFSLVAGHLELGEDLPSAARREIREEVGYEEDDLSPLSLCFQATRLYPAYSYLDFFFAADVLTDREPVLEHGKATEARWAAADALPEKTIDYVAACLGRIAEAPDVFGALSFCYDAPLATARRVESLCVVGEGGGIGDASAT